MLLIPAAAKSAINLMIAQAPRGLFKRARPATQQMSLLSKLITYCEAVCTLPSKANLAVFTFSKDFPDLGKKQNTSQKFVFLVLQKSGSEEAVFAATNEAQSEAAEVEAAFRSVKVFIRH